MKKRKAKIFLNRMAVLVVILAMLISMFSAAYATTANQNILEDRNGVLCIEYGYAKDSKFEAWGVGSAFLINENTLLTCFHSVHTDDETAKEIMGDSYDAKWEKNMAIRVVLANGTTVLAKERLGNAEVDFSILTLQDTVANHQILTLRKDPVSTSESITALGFPYTVSALTEGTATKFTAEDVTTTSGTISKANTVIDGISYIQHNALVQGGNSGGPLVDNDGYVVGINAAVDNDRGNYCYAVAIDQVIISLDALGIEYTPASGSDPVDPPVPDPVDPPVPDPNLDPVTVADKTALNSAISDAERRNEEDYTAETWSAMGVALDAAKAVADKADVEQDEVDSATDALKEAVTGLVDKPAGISPVLIGGIAAAVVVVIVVVLIIVVMSGKKNKKKGTAGSSSGNSGGASYSYGTDSGFSRTAAKEVSYGGDRGYGNAGETDVLDSGAPGTTLLTGTPETSLLSSKPYATLTRRSTGEKASANKPNFTIGRERRNVDYYVSNNAVGRTHAKLVNENGRVYVIDIGSKNGTFVNGSKCAANVKVELHTGDKLTLADEDFDVTLG